MRVFDPSFYDSLAARAAASPRRRLNFNLHDDNDYPCHRIFNAVQPDSYIPVHRHLAPEKDESVVVVRGLFGFAEFDDSGSPVATHVLSPGMAIDIPHGSWHTCVALAPGSVFFETKAGPFIPRTPEELAPFFPPESSPDAPAALVRLRALFPESP